MPVKRLLLTAVLGLTLTATGCCRMYEHWCAPRQQPCCAPPAPCQQGCPAPQSYYAPPQCPQGCVPANGNAVPTVNRWNNSPNCCN